MLAPSFGAYELLLTYKGESFPEWVLPRVFIVTNSVSQTREKKDVYEGKCNIAQQVSIFSSVLLIVMQFICISFDF